jgi:RNA 2',3'-cyclic 3'-phosphodiesterase
MSADVEAAIVEMISALREQPNGIRWVRPANLHLTLRFLGNAVDRAVVLKLDEILAGLAGQTSPFMLHARGTGAFPNLDRPRTIWIGLASGELMRLARQIEDAAVQVGLAPEARSYTPHLTIGRVRDLRRWQRLRQALAQSSTQDFGSTLVSEMTLYRSIVGGEASRYEALARYPFTTDASA